MSLRTTTEKFTKTVKNMHEKKTKKKKLHIN